MRQRLWAPRWVHFAAGITAVSMAGMATVWSALSDVAEAGEQVDFVIGVLVLGSIPYVLYLLLLGPTLIGRGTLRARRVEALRATWLKKGATE